MTLDQELSRLEDLLVGMQAADVAAGEDCLAEIRDLLAKAPTAEAAVFAARIRTARDLAASARLLWEQTLECAGSGTWTGYGIPAEHHSGPSVRA